MVRPSQTSGTVSCRWLCLVGLAVWLWSILVCQHGTVQAVVGGIYVNNQRLEKVEADRWKLLRPTVAPDGPLSVTKGELLTKANFTGGAASDPAASLIHLFWDQNTRPYGESAPTTPVQYADELSSIKNTLHDDDEDLSRPSRLQRPSTTLAPSTTSTPVPRTTTVKLKPNNVRKMAARKPTVSSATTDKRKTELTPELMAMLQRYYSFSCTLVPKHLERTPTTQPPVSTTTSAPRTSKPPKRRNKPTTVYVDPPVIKRLGGMLESVYDFMENALTSTEIRSSTEPMPVRKVKRNTAVTPEPSITERQAYVSSEEDQDQETGWKRFTGPDRVTIAGLPAVLSTGTEGNKNKMTTNIQVTSEYTAATPATVPLKKPNRIDDDSSESEDESGDYYGGFDDVDDDDEDEDDSEDEEEDEALEPNRRRRPRPSTAVTNDKDYEDGGAISSETGERPIRKRRRRKKPPTASYGSSSYEDDDEDDDEDDEVDEDEVDYSSRNDGSEEGEDDEEEDEPPGGFFSGMFATFSRFVRSLGFGGTFRGGGDYDDEDRGRSTTPRVQAIRRRPTRSTAGWLPFPPLQAVENDDEQLSTVETVTDRPAATATSWFDLMMPWDFFNPWATEELEPTGEAITEEAPSSWSLPFGQWFGDSSTTSTQAPSTTSNVPPVPEQLLSVLSQYVATAGPNQKPTTRKPTTRKRRSYAGYQLWRLTVKTEQQLHSLTDYRRSPAGLELQWWIGPSLRGPTDVLVPPGSACSNFQDYLRDAGIAFETTIHDLGRAIGYEQLSRRDQLETELVHGHRLTWYRYHRYADIVQFLGALHRHHSHRVQLLHIGRSYEGRPLTVVRVSFARRSRKPRRRPAIFIEAGAHGREWIGPAVATWLLNRLLDIPAANGTGEQEQRLDSVRSYDWYVLPVLNPDGYEYSHEHDRMWCKSRGNVTDDRPEQGILSSALSSWWQGSATGSDDGSERRCIGVNLDRNWGHRWGEGTGTSRSKCSEDYAGRAPFSEPETRALRDFLLGSSRRSALRLYLSLRSYGQALSYPTEENENELDQEAGPGRDEDVHEMASVGLEALRAGGSEQQYRLSAIGGPASGTAVEYARYRAGIRYAYTLRLPDTGTHGFLLPPSNIVSIGRDLFELIKGMIEYN